MDVTLSCDGQQIKAHKVFVLLMSLSCSCPFHDLVLHPLPFMSLSILCPVHVHVSVLFMSLSLSRPSLLHVLVLFMSLSCSYPCLVHVLVLPKYILIYFSSHLLKNPPPPCIQLYWQIFNLLCSGDTVSLFINLQESTQTKPFTKSSHFTMGKLIF